MGKPIVVFGSFVVDLTSRSKGLPEPGQTLLGNGFKIGPGGKGSNQAVAAHRAGAAVTLVTKLGRDLFADIALDFYKSEGMDTTQILVDEHYETGIALIMVDENTAQNKIVVVIGACGNITPEDVSRCHSLIEGASILLVQLEINLDALYQVIDIAHKAGVMVVLNPAPAIELSAEVMNKIDIIAPNETEAMMLTGVKVKTEIDAKNAAMLLLEKGSKNVVITMGSKGVFATNGVRDEFLPGLRLNTIDTTGAGDAFLGGFVMALSESRNIFEALRFGNAAGALSTTKIGTAPSMPSRAEIDAIVSEHYNL